MTYIIIIISISCIIMFITSTYVSITITSIIIIMSTLRGPSRAVYDH